MTFFGFKSIARCFYQLNYTQTYNNQFDWFELDYYQINQIKAKYTYYKNRKGQENVHNIDTKEVVLKVPTTVCPTGKQIFVVYFNTVFTLYCIRAARYGRDHFKRFYHRINMYRLWFIVNNSD
jgi:hypothetical protein